MDKTILDQSYKLSREQIDYFRENGFIKLKNVLSPEVIDYYEKEITKKVVELNTMNLPMEERDTYQKAFLQIFNLWEKSEIVREFVFCKRLAKLATDLLGTTGVRIYHDQALYKEPGGGITPWHADQYYWPVSNEKIITVWIPLQETGMDMGPLAFAAKSQNFSFGRDLAISDESEAQLQKALKEANFDVVNEPFELGEVSYHYGWTFHNAGANDSDKPRRVMTAIYMDEDMKLIKPVNDNQVFDWENWCPGAKIGEVIATKRNPVVYSNLQ